jgi:hypothetical protein
MAEKTEYSNYGKRDHYCPESNPSDYFPVSITHHGQKDGGITNWVQYGKKTNKYGG